MVITRHIALVYFFDGGVNTIRADSIFPPMFGRLINHAFTGDS
ncbi:hypothetical protein VIBNISOn1_1390014 [Vibrio nigripulchritudo SOn1]|uniref:Uncharacterized protein n=1 Tax=Vibrio nigripulchritudo SOn1 TaxID=1238450 RepID=A0AAV2VKF0_9VIBR|nr:hypothetical protein VIBNISOn1_1390014 [Vibrio nigripulchritudo SOn1]